MPVSDLVSEAVFTQPRAECPYPEMWSARDTDSSEQEVTDFVHALVRLLKPEFVVETGSCYGFTTEAIGRALQANEHGRAVSLELDPVRARTAAGRCDGLPVKVLNHDSLDYTPPGPVTLAFLDSEFQLRVAEWMLYRPEFAVFHDSGDHYPLRHQIEGLVEGGYVSAVFMPTPRGICLTQRIGG
jgi:hypothetical protein